MKTSGDLVDPRQNTSLAFMEHIFLVQEYRGNQLSEAGSMSNGLDLRVGGVTAALALPIAGFIAL